tara:strand:- start:3887 stop:4519 length:633 start_codon:yes stop_codon:yes gene_type:complete
MATLNQIAFNIANAAGKNTDPVFVNRIKFQIEYFRALFLRRDAERNFGIPDAFVQTRVLDMEWVPAVEACGVSLPCQILKSKEKICTPINLKGQTGFVYVGAVGGSESFQYVSPEQVVYALQSKFTGNQTKYFYKDGYLYVTEGSPMCVEVRMACESPATGGEEGVEGLGCIDHDAEYPVTMDMVQRITEAILNQLQADTLQDNGQVEIE